MGHIATETPKSAPWTFLYFISLKVYIFNGDLYHRTVYQHKKTDINKKNMIYFFRSRLQNHAKNNKYTLNKKCFNHQSPLHPIHSGKGV